MAMPTLNPGNAAAAGTGVIEFNPALVSFGSPLPGGGPRTLPSFLTRAQLYYWTSVWQAGEAEALGELEAGEGRVFPDGQAAVRWLLSEDED